MVGPSRASPSDRQRYSFPTHPVAPSLVLKIDFAPCPLPATGTERRYGAGGEDGNFVAASNDGVPRCPSRTT
jgi:hypothetical protein